MKHWIPLECDDFESVVVHMCQFGLTAVDELGQGYAMKPMDPYEYAGHCSSGRSEVQSRSPTRCSYFWEAKAAAKYTYEFCRSIVDLVSTYDLYLDVLEDIGSFDVDEGEFGSEKDDDSCTDDDVVEERNEGADCEGELKANGDVNKNREEAEAEGVD